MNADELRVPLKTLAANRSMWLCYMLYDQGYVSQEKAAELSPANLHDFRVFCKEVADD